MMKRLLIATLVFVLLFTTVTPALADTTYVVKSGDTLGSISRQFGVTLTALMQANGITNADLIFVGQTLRIPTGRGPVNTPAPTSPPSTGTGSGACGAVYTIVRGDTLGIIARKCGVTASAILAVNTLANPSLIYPGQKLAIPGGGTSNPPPAGTPAPTAAPTNPPTTGGTSTCGAVYTIVAGDTLGIISRKCGVTASAILAVNNIANPSLIYPGQKLAIPGGQGSPSTPAPSTPAPGATATPPPAATATPPPAPVTGARGVTGTLTLCNPEKPSFAADIERICFRELIVNTNNTPISYGILGVRATNLTGGPSQFQTSWRGDLVLGAGAQGPAGGGWEDGIYIDEPGTYRLQLAICFNSVDVCQSGSGWETLTGGVDVKVVFWQP